MEDLDLNLDELKFEEGIFQDVKFYVSGQVHEKILDLLRMGNAERMDYFSDYVTHLICGVDPDENDITDASEVYEIPLVTTRWVVTSVKAKRKLKTTAFKYDSNQLFSDLVFCFSKITDDKHALWSLITYFGGTVQHNLNSKCTHLITSDIKSEKYMKAFSLGDTVKIVTIDWVRESVMNRKLSSYELFHPKLLTWPKPKESTAFITGFENDESEKTSSDIPEIESTLLDQLKQRMPWNQPATPTTTATPTANFQNFMTQNSEPVTPTKKFWPQPPPTTPIATNNNFHASNFNAQETPQQTNNQRLPWNQTPCIATATNQQQDVSPVKQPQLAPPPPPPPPPPPQKLQQQLQQHQQPQNMYNNNLPSSQQMDTGLQVNSQQQTANIINQQIQTSQAQQNQILNQQQLYQQRVQQIRTSLAQQSQQFTTTKPQLSLQSNMSQNPQNQLNPNQQLQNQLNSNQQIQNQLNSNQQIQNQLNPNQQIQNQLNPNSQLQNQLSLSQNQSSQMGTNQLVQQPQNQMNAQQPQNHLQQNPIAVQQQNQINVQTTQQISYSSQMPPNQMNPGLQSPLNQQGNQITLNQQGNQLTLNQQGNQLTLNQQSNQISLNQQGNQLSLSQQGNQITLNQQGNQIQQNRTAFIGQNQILINQGQNQGQFKLQGHLQGQPQQVQIVQQHIQNQNLNAQNSNQIGLIQGQRQQVIHSQPQLLQQNRLNQFGNQQSQQIGNNNQQQIQFPVQQQQNNFARTNINADQIQFQNANQVQINQPEQQNQGVQIYGLQTQQQTQPNQNQVVTNQFLQQQQQQKLQQQQQQQRAQLIPTNWQHQQVQQPQIVNQQLAQQLNSQQQLSTAQQLNPQLNQQLNQQLVPQVQAQAQVLQQQRQQQLTQQTINNQQHLVQQQLNQQHLVQQQTQLQGVQRHPTAIVAPRLNWSPNQPQGAMPQRQLIHLDAQTHQQLQQMDPQQRALFVAKLQKQRQLLLQQRQQQMLHQQRGGQIAVIRGGIPAGLNPQQQMQWIQQQPQQQQQGGAKPPQIVMQQQHAPGLSPIAQNPPVIGDQAQQIQRQQFHRLQQLQIQREQASKQMQQQVTPPVAVVRPSLPVDSALPIVSPLQGADQQPLNTAGPNNTVVQQPNQQLVVNPKTKTALANMLSIRLQSGGGNIPQVEGEPSAAGTLRLMTAQHNASLNQSPRQDLLLQPRRPMANLSTNLNATNGAAVNNGIVGTPELARPAAPVQSAASVGVPAPVQDGKFSPGRNITQQRHGPFYGHNPNLKLPPDLFLLGCIFVVVEVGGFLEENTPDWREVIEQHGGEIEPVYCSRVTHVLCETQRHGVVMQALRDFKRCVTLFWLDDVMKRKQVLPPWQALHLPTGYVDGAPATKHLISLSGFTGVERNRVKEMVRYTGAKMTTYFSRHNTVLVCGKADGKKFNHAKKWGTPVVNVQWLTDLMLGNFSALNQIEHSKYQQFPQPVQFGFDTALVPNLMFSWKMPINISQESYERVKRSSSPVVLPPKAKKPKLEPISTPIKEEEITSKEFSNAHKILFSSFNRKTKTNLEKIVLSLGGSIAKNIEEATHLVMPHLARSEKLLYAIVKGLKIVPTTWLKQSNDENKFLIEESFKFDTKEFNSTFNCDFYKTLESSNRNKLLQSKVFYLTPSIIPSYKTVKELIEWSGGVVEKQRRTLQQIQAANQILPYSYIILTNENDLHLVNDCLRSSKTDKIKYVGSTEVVLMAILNQKFSMDVHLVKVY